MHPAAGVIGPELRARLTAHLGCLQAGKFSEIIDTLEEIEPEPDVVPYFEKITHPGSRFLL